MQDAFCTLSTGGGFATRTLFTNTEETVINVLRPVIINGISQLATNQDLIDRLIHIDVPELKTRIAEKTLKEKYTQDKSKILAGLFDLFSKALKILPAIEIENPPRMGDFAFLGEAVSLALGHDPGFFIGEYNDKRSAALIGSLDNSSVGGAILNYFNHGEPPIDQSYVRDVFKLLEDYKPSGETWVKTPKGFASQLQRITPGLKEAGIKIKFHKRDTNGVRVSIWDIEPTARKEGNKSHTIVKDRHLKLM